MLNIKYVGRHFFEELHKLYMNRFNCGFRKHRLICVRSFILLNKFRLRFHFNLDHHNNNWLVFKFRKLKRHSYKGDKMKI